jgi:hypothetical protein
VFALDVRVQLPRTLLALYDAEVSNGYVLVGVERPDDNAEATTRALEAAGPGRVKSGRDAK